MDNSLIVERDMLIHSQPIVFLHFFLATVVFVNISKQLSRGRLALLTYC